MAAPFFDASDRERIHREMDAILDGLLSMGPNVRAFEEEFARLVGVRHAIAMNACTSTLEAALLAFDVRGREVIIPPETFIATGMAVHLTGGLPVFAEIRPDTLCLDLDDVKSRVTERTAGVILVHMAGLVTPDILEFRDFCDARGIFLLEDAAHSPGACVDGRQAGSFGHAGCFSFFSTKVLAAGEGGMLTTDDDRLASFARSFQHRGRDLEAPGEQYVMPGRNVRLTELNALLGRVQLSHLGEYLDGRQHLAARYIERLSGLNTLALVAPPALENSSFWKFPVLLPPGCDRTEVTARLSDAGIAADWAYQPALHLQPVFRELLGTTEGTLPQSEAILGRHLCLPCHPGLSHDDVDYVCEHLAATLRALES
jgi:dTDP-4-amino-4,6-dideoxygalactose transaminase